MIMLISYQLKQGLTNLLVLVKKLIQLLLNSNLQLTRIDKLRYYKVS